MTFIIGLPIATLIIWVAIFKTADFSTVIFMIAAALLGLAIDSARSMNNPNQPPPGSYGDGNA